MMMNLTVMLMMMVVVVVVENMPEVDSQVEPEAECAEPCEHLSPWDTEIPSNLSSSTRCLEVSETQIRVIVQGAFSNLTLLRTLTIQGNSVLERIGSSAIANLPQLTKIFIEDNSALERIGSSAIANLPQLTHILISGNPALKAIGAFAIADLPELKQIFISFSQHLSTIHPDAFRNLRKLDFLTISYTGLTIFPNLTKIHSTADDFVLDLHHNSQLTRIPANAFRGLCNETVPEIRLTRNGIKEVASDAFNGTKMQNLDLRGNAQLTLNPNAFVGSSDLAWLDVSETAISSLPQSITGGLQKLVAESAPYLKELPPVFTNLKYATLTYPSHCCAFKNMQRNRSWHHLCQHPKITDEPAVREMFCNNSTSIVCSPVPDAFNLCEDIMSSIFLRILIWLISVPTLLGNGAVLLVLLGSHNKLTVPRFLMCHLAFADLCMGIYLIVIATMDVLFRGRYYNYAIDWQGGLGCSAAGFFTVFASELSVFTLTAITLERWHTITYAMRLDRKIRLRHACIIMAAGWIFSSLAALLPTVGVSSYKKVSICLPMDVESLPAQIFIMSLLLLNILAFFVVSGCYLSIYLTVRNPSSGPANADTHVAQRMAVLIFTDFICMAPISFFAISAALKLPLITVSQSKLLLVVFYPINSCANPFLYAFFTRSFRQDFFLLAARFGLFKTRAQVYRMESFSSQQQQQHGPPPKTNHVVLYSLVNALSLDETQEC